MSVNGEKYIFYHYDPSTVAAVIFVVLFGLSSLGHAVQLLLKRTWYFIPFVVGGLFETVGYVGRLLSSLQASGEWTTVPYVMQSLLLLLAPALFAASIYMILGRIIVLVDGERHSLIRVTWLTKVFVGGDVLSFLAQSAGGGMLSKAKSTSDVKLGEHVIVAGLGIQVVFFALFCIAAAVFHYRIAKYPTIRSQTVSVPWVKYLWILYFVSTLILVRSVFRIAEYVMGGDGYLLRHEIFLYIFDATLMFLSMAIFNLFHPSRIINKHSKALEGGVHPDTELGDVEVQYVSASESKHGSRR